MLKSKAADNNRQALNHLHHSTGAKMKKFQDSGRTLLHGEKFAQKVTKEAGDLTFNSIPIFELGQDEAGSNKYLNDAKLVIKVSSLSGGTGGSYRRLVDGFAAALFKSIEIKYNSNRILLYDSKEEIHQMLKLSHTYDEWQTYSSNYGYLSASDRNSASSNSQTFILPLMRIFKFLAQKRFPLWKLKHDLRFEFSTEEMSKLTETDHSSGNVSFTIEDMYMDVEMIRDDGAYAYDSKIEVDSFTNFIPKVRNIYVNNSATQAQEVITELQNENILFITLAMTNNSNYSANDYFTYSQIDQYSLEANGNRIHGSNYDITDSDFKNIYLPRYEPLNYRDIKDDNLYIVYYGSRLAQDMLPFNPSKLNSFQNELTYARKFTENTVKFIFRWNSGVTGNHTIRMVAYTIEHLVLKNGELNII